MGQLETAAAQDTERMLIKARQERDEARQERDKALERVEHYKALSLVLGKKLNDRDSEARAIPEWLTDEQRKQRLVDIWNAI